MPWCAQDPEMVLVAQSVGVDLLQQNVTGEAQKMWRQGHVYTCLMRFVSMTTWMPQLRQATLPRWCEKTFSILLQGTVHKLTVDPQINGAFDDVYQQLCDATCETKRQIKSKIWLLPEWKQECTNVSLGLLALPVHPARITDACHAPGSYSQNRYWNERNLDTTAHKSELSTNWNSWKGPRICSCS